MYAVKEASIAKEHSKKPLDTAIFFMDIRTHGKDFERYYERARERDGTRFVRSRVHSIFPVEGGDDLMVKYATEKGEFLEEVFDMVVLSVGLETSTEVKEMAQRLGIALTEGSFCQTGSFNPVATSREGLYVSGAFQGPKDIPQAVIEASSAAAVASTALMPARHTLTKSKAFPKEKGVAGERPRVGVFVCRCGINIAGVVDVPVLCAYAETLPYVEFVSDNLYSCSQDTQDIMAQVINENNLNRIVVAACTPKTHEPLFQETLANAGLNKYLFEMANIRNQDSWVHRDEPVRATEKAKDLLRMAVSKAALSESLNEAELDINQTALVVGGGISGMTAAKALAENGYQVCLVEGDISLGGQARDLFQTWKGEDVQGHLFDLIGAVESNEKIEVHLQTTLTHVEGFVGNFKSALSSGKGDRSIEHGVAVIATGGFEYKPEEYMYGEDPRVMTHLELDRKFINNDPFLKDVRAAAFIQCVGSRESNRPYCSRVCCTHSIESALHLKEINPEMDIYILYRDIRTYGEREFLYRRAREAGILFIRFSLDEKPSVAASEKDLEIQVFEPVLQRYISLNVDLLALASAIVSYQDDELARFFKVPMNEDGFFVEAHAKLAPSEFATDGVFLSGLAHYPKPIDESVAQAQSAASKASIVLAKRSMRASGTVAYVTPATCSSCGACVDICPYGAPSFTREGPFAGKAEVNPVLCKGCGLCAASCRSGALRLRGFEEGQIMVMIDEI